MKINVDATIARYFEYRVVSAVCCDHGVTYLGASAIVFGWQADPVTLEALAVGEELALADDLYVQWIHVASDFKVVVEDIKQESSTSYEAIIHEIIYHSSTFTIRNFVLELRSSKFEAHNLAKHALSHGVGRNAWLG